MATASASPASSRRSAPGGSGSATCPRRQKTFDRPRRAARTASLGTYLDHRHAGPDHEGVPPHLRPRGDSLHPARPASQRAPGRTAPRPGQEELHQGPRDQRARHRDAPRRATVIYTYDNETRVRPAEDSDTRGVTHGDREAASEITINAAKTHWDYTGGGWSGGNDGSFYVTTLSDWPADPDAARRRGAVIGIFGSRGRRGAQRPSPRAPRSCRCSTAGRPRRRGRPAAAARARSPWRT